MCVDEWKKKVLQNESYCYHHQIHVEADVHGLQADMELRNPVHAPIPALLGVVWAEQHATHPVAMALLLLARARGIVLLEALSLAQLVIHKAVMALAQHVPTHALLEAPSAVPHVTFHKALLIHIHVRLEDPSLVQHVHFLHQELRNMDAPMAEHKAVVSASCPQDNA